MTMLSALPKRVPIIEDEAAIAFNIEDVLREAGLAPVGPTLTVQDALRMVGAGGIDAAVVDVGMVQGRRRNILSRLTTAGIPFLFLTGYGTLELPLTLPRADTVLKPFHASDLLRSLSDLLAVDTATASTV